MNVKPSSKRRQAYPLINDKVYSNSYPPGQVFDEDEKLLHRAPKAVVQHDVE